MKKTMAVAFVLFSIIGMSSCNYDDSNDIDVLTPNDSTEGQVIDQYNR